MFHPKRPQVRLYFVFVLFTLVCVCLVVLVRFEAWHHKLVWLVENGGQVRFVGKNSNPHLSVSHDDNVISRKDSYFLDIEEIRFSSPKSKACNQAVEIAGKCNKLKLLSVNGPATTLRSLKNCLNLTTLSLTDCEVINFNLAPLVSLRSLCIKCNSIENLNFVEGMNDLYLLRVEGKCITDISAVESLSSLERLEVKGLQLETIAHVLQLRKLTHLSLEESSVTSWAALGDLRHLQWFSYTDSNVPEKTVDLLRSRNPNVVVFY